MILLCAISVLVMSRPGQVVVRMTVPAGLPSFRRGLSPWWGRPARV